MDSGEQFVVMHGTEQMQEWPVDSLATQESVGPNFNSQLLLWKTMIF